MSAGPAASFVGDSIVSKAKAASSLSTLTPAVPYEADAEVVESFTGETLTDAPCDDHWHCDQKEAAHVCTKPDRTKSCPGCGARPVITFAPSLTDVVMNRETARAQLIELFYASLPEAEIGRAINLLAVVMP